ncbi:MAG: replicative DNA helicase [Bacillota bacterium]
MNTTERLPPQNLEAEQSVLGSMLIEKEAILKACEILSADDFYREAHRIIFDAIVDVFERGEAVDLITVSERLRQLGKIEAVGDIPALAALANMVPTAANIEYYARIVEEKAVLRRLISAGTEIVRMGYEAQQEPEEVLDQAEQMVFRISKRRSSQGYHSIKDVLVEAFEHIESIYTNKEGITGIPTGFKEIDMLTSGLQKSDLIVIAARPSMGKTMLCLNIARNAAVLRGVPVVIFSLEMSKEQMAQRLLCMEAGVDSQRLRTGYLQEGDWGRLSRAFGQLSEAPVFIDDTPNLSVMEVRAKSRRIKAEHDLGLVVIDYLQLMQMKGRVESRQQEISEISRSLKALARELKVPIIAASQLSRAVESRVDKRPLLSDLRESGAIEQDADVVAFIYRDEYYNRESEKRNIAEIIIAKQRNGPTGTVELAFLKESGRFATLERRRVEGG